MAVSKVVYGATVLVDLTSDTVAADKLLSGATAHDKAGNPITGTFTYQNCYSGSGEPSAALGADGDLYIDVG